MRAMSGLNVFWCGHGQGSGYVGLIESGEIIGVLRTLKRKISFYEKNVWKGLSWRGEAQDMFMDGWSVKGVEAMLRRAEKIFDKEGLTDYGVSEWKPDGWRTLEELGLSPYARSVLIGWSTEESIRKRANPEVEVKVAGKEELRALKKIQLESWGFYIPPKPKHHKILIAYLGEEAVGCAYLNKHSGNIDFGVHVRRKFQRKRVGASILHAAQRLFKEMGFKQMYVVRVLRTLTKVNEADKIALRFYTACGGRILREYRGFKRKVRKRDLRLPPLSRFL